MPLSYPRLCYAGRRLAPAVVLVAALLGGCASGSGSRSGNADASVGRESGITVFGTVDAAVSHTRNR